MARVLLRETGGPMVGYETVDGALVVTDVSGPGRRGRKNFFRVWIDGEHSRRFSDRSFYESGGIVDYIGDWHCHPGFSVLPSTQDEAATRTVAETKGILPNPISIIFSRLNGRFQAYYWTGDVLQEVGSSVYRLSPQEKHRIRHSARSTFGG